jgi:hypothetical protein
MATSYQQLALDVCCTGDLDCDALIRWSTESTARGHSSTPRPRFSVRLHSARRSKSQCGDYSIHTGDGAGLWYSDFQQRHRQRINRSCSDAHRQRSVPHRLRGLTQLDLPRCGPQQLRVTGEDGSGDATAASQRRQPLKPTPLMWKAVSPSYPEAVEGLEGHEAQPSKVDFLHTVIYTGLSTI